MPRSKRVHWKTLHEVLLKFKTSKGHTNVPANYAKCPALGSYVRNARMIYRQEQEGQDGHRRMDREEKASLNAMGFEWTLQNKKKREYFENLNALKKFKAEFGHCNVPELYEGDRELAQWCVEQREALRGKRKLGKGRRKVLMDLGFSLPSNDSAAPSSAREEGIVESLPSNNSNGNDAAAPSFARGEGDKESCIQEGNKNCSDEELTDTEEAGKEGCTTNSASGAEEVENVLTDSASGAEEVGNVLTDHTITLKEGCAPNSASGAEEVENVLIDHTITLEESNKENALPNDNHCSGRATRKKKKRQSNIQRHGSKPHLRTRTRISRACKGGGK